MRPRVTVPGESIIDCSSANPVRRRAKSRRRAYHGRVPVMDRRAGARFEDQPTCLRPLRTGARYDGDRRSTCAALFPLSVEASSGERPWRSLLEPSARASWASTSRRSVWTRVRQRTTPARTSPATCMMGTTAFATWLRLIEWSPIGAFEESGAVASSAGRENDAKLIGDFRLRGGTDGQRSRPRRHDVAGREDAKWSRVPPFRNAIAPVLRR